MKDILIKERFRVDRVIAEGGFGRIYIGTDLQSREEVAIKLERGVDSTYSLQVEEWAYGILTGGTGIPRCIWIGEECEYYVLVSELLGPTLEDLFIYCGLKFSLKTVLLLADQLLSRIEYIHSKLLIHCDIKPNNLLMGSGKAGNLVYVVDFGLTRHYYTNEKYPIVKSGGFVGTAWYASINAMRGMDQAPRDDLESLGYVLVHFARGYLPWQDLKGTPFEKANQVLSMKMKLPIEELCKDLPAEFETFIRYTQSLPFNGRPDYAYLRKLFRRLFSRKGFEYDHVFDWTVKRFSELHGASDALE